MRNFWADFHFAHTNVLPPAPERGYGMQMGFTSTDVRRIEQKTAKLISKSSQFILRPGKKLQIAIRFVLNGPFASSGTAKFRMQMAHASLGSPAR